MASTLHDDKCLLLLSLAKATTNHSKGMHGQHQRLSFGDSTSPLTPLLSGEDREPGAVVTCKKDGHQKEKKKKKKEGKSPHHSRGELGTLCLSDRGRVEAARIMILGGINRVGAAVPAFLRTPTVIQPHLDMKPFLQFSMETAPPQHSMGLFHNFNT
ncbi:unnamed protein product, partial [Gadus morhua 'NCC']